MFAENITLQNKKVLITGHTGFKGAWLSKMMLMLGADVSGYALEPPTNPALFDLLGLKHEMRSYIGDIREFDRLKKVFEETKPDYVIHMAAQPLVRTSYEKPAYTFETNVMGTVNVLDCIRQCDSVTSFLNVTTDKVYKNSENGRDFVETDELNGYDPYSNSKSCSELVTDCYKKSFLEAQGIAVSTARAGNVIGGGDFADNRIIPDCIRAFERKENIVVRNPYSVRPYQHVLEALGAYILILTQQKRDISKAGNYNIGPQDGDCLVTSDIVTRLCDKWYKSANVKINWITDCDKGPHEANILKLNCDKIHNVLGWERKWDINTALDKIVEWNKEYIFGGDILKCTENQIREFLKAN